MGSEAFLTLQKKDFKWPSNKPLAIKPAQPPIKTKALNYFVAKQVEPYCHCDAHLYDPDMQRYQRLAAKEKLLHEELLHLNTQMARLSSDLLDHPCDTADDKMETIYESDYIKRGLNLTKYRKLMPAVDSPVGVPTKDQSIGLGMGYRDPTRFRYSAFSRPVIQPCPPVSFARTPCTVDMWFETTTGRTEYQDTVSKTGMSIVKSSQQYMEPLPSSRRRFGDPCL